MSLNAIATPAARDPGPLVTRCRRNSSRQLSAWKASEPPKPASTQSVLTAAVSETLANPWQTTLSGCPADALCLVEHSMSYPNPTEMHDRMSNLAAAADWPRQASD